MERKPFFVTLSKLGDGTNQSIYEFRYETPGGTSVLVTVKAKTEDDAKVLIKAVLSAAAKTDL